MTEINGSIPHDYHDKKLYEQEYKHGAELFQRALDEYGKAVELHKKAAFKEVMEKTLQVMNETARELKRPDLEKQNTLIARDYKGYTSDENNRTKTKLVKDLERAKGALG